MEDMIKRLLGEDKDKDDPRRQAEMKVVWRLLDTVLEQGQEMLVAKRRERLEGTAGGRTSTPDLTDREQAIFSRPSYYGWTEGTIAGGLTFVVLFGGLRLAALRSGRTAARLPPPPRRDYGDLDGPAKAFSRHEKGNSSRRRSETTSSPHHQHQQQQQPSSEALALSEDVMMQLQFMCTGAMALAVMSFTANRCSDLPKFYRELSVLPLQAGSSPFCHNMCPDLIQQMQQLRMNRNNNNSNRIINNTQSPDQGASEDSRRSSTALKFETSEMLRDPVTEELESMVRLVQNCQQRAAFEQELRQEQGIQDSNQVMDIPAPGVPPNYLGVSVDVDVDGGDDDTASSGDWAKRLVMDREEKGGRSE
jgi:hypothetical protein